MFTWMASGRCIMTGFNDLSTEVFIIWNIKLSFIIEETILLFPFK